jgi:hypothetical protein
MAEGAANPLIDCSLWLKRLSGSAADFAAPLMLQLVEMKGYIFRIRAAMEKPAGFRRLGLLLIRFPTEPGLFPLSAFSCQRVIAAFLALSLRCLGGELKCVPWLYGFQALMSGIHLQKIRKH